MYCKKKEKKKSNYKMAYLSLTLNNRISNFQESIDFIYQNLDLVITYILKQVHIFRPQGSLRSGNKKGIKISLDNSVRCFSCFTVSEVESQHTPAYCSLPILAKP